VFESGMGCENRVVWFHNRICKCRSRVDAELELALLAIVRGEPLKDKRAETRTSPTTKGVENKEALEARAIVSKTSNPIYYVVNLLLPDRIVSTGVWQKQSQSDVLYM
jgi:hypothetical protein